MDRLLPKQLQNTTQATLLKLYGRILLKGGTLSSRERLAIKRFGKESRDLIDELKRDGIDTQTSMALMLANALNGVISHFEVVYKRDSQKDIDSLMSNFSKIIEKTGLEMFAILREYEQGE